MLKKILSATAVSFAITTSALAAPVDDAQAHFNAIAAGDVAAIMQQYGAQPILEWVGGPLDGTYVGADKVRETWGKFTKGSPNLKASVGKMEESANPKGATVTANVVFQGQNAIKVRYVLTYREGKIVNEIWQIDPKLAVAAY
ncbi:hypothetical protein TPL01_10830 [Sulfuriferula plumbiphila]|uniref:SnoaL-like domain-containing protein n=1 Tax=Sulfuriferula plumbiphila TaxID=171865 RepID=A0A512L640_9PROT|nr:nuclear transport factor 2 family protein [Sulfuriferula plumbiphila]BBP03544.1 hypothetical protein SFPGR_09660 [Sulfuriferula plumbiphila]GEP29945.1 hypothetical protein TPL01_10830 [Sulfuriferula plumbiphila]